MNKPTENEFHTIRGYQLKQQNESGLTPALEDYLEMTYRLCVEEKYTRINKLSKSLHVSPPAASKMVSKLVEFGFLEYDSLECIRLTKEGKCAGAYLLERHYIMESFFSLLGSETPLKETELVEHMLCRSTVLKIQALVDFFNQNTDLHQQFHSFIDSYNFSKI
ncbi:metal-dependent transcriptional regulator [Kineothrix sp. MB12-C1]|uniref:metal-dependent transcriptional regulator n=1 Tax=Kineothrix sp. MB12-C1 TaxID=3070215 RepID=UPI0027D2B352|nr:DtxR family transcriptional regulator [Kineothrix sp. MB12-C1]WMC93067.1 iron dependent repressor, metal binding and dimerization domain protein [Kineothrix sp. MB12-C1]